MPKEKRRQWNFKCKKCGHNRHSMTSKKAVNSYAEEHSVSCPGERNKISVTPEMPMSPAPAPQTPPPNSTPSSAVEMRTPRTVLKWKADSDCVCQELAQQVKFLKDQVERQRVLIAEHERFRRNVTTDVAQIYQIHGLCEKVCALHHTLQGKRGHRKGEQPCVALAPVKEYFHGHGSEKQDAILRELLGDLVTTCPLARLLDRHLEARNKCAQLSKTLSQHVIVDGNLFDNLGTAILEHPNRITDKWLLEFVRTCDLSRLLSMDGGPNAMKGFRYSPLIKSFSATLRYHCNESTYNFAIAHPGNDPDTAGYVNLLGPCDAGVQRHVRLALQESSPGFIDDKRISEIKDEYPEIKTSESWLLLNNAGAFSIGDEQRRS